MLPSFLVPIGCRRRRSRRNARGRDSLNGLLSDFSSYKVSPFGSKTDSTDKRSDNTTFLDLKDKAEFSLFKCSISWNKEDMIEMENVPVGEVKSVAPKFLPGSCNDGLPYPTWMNGANSDDRVRSHSLAEPLPIVPLFSAVGDIDAWLTPGSVVWAKTTCHDWWPAKIMNEEDALQCIITDNAGHVLVQLYGNHEQTWLDPVKDLSQFDYCYDERAKNPSQTFQDALQQALYNYVKASSNLEKGRSSVDVKTLQLCDSGREGNHEGVIRQSGRKRKLKVHFDEAIPETRTKTPRRIKIMRQLGLIAPAGSPFSLTTRNRRAAQRSVR